MQRMPSDLKALAAIIFIENLRSLDDAVEYSGSINLTPVTSFIIGGNDEKKFHDILLDEYGHRIKKSGEYIIIDQGVRTFAVSLDKIPGANFLTFYKPLEVEESDVFIDIVKILKKLGCTDRLGTKFLKFSINGKWHYLLDDLYSAYVFCGMNLVSIVGLDLVNKAYPALIHVDDEFPSIIDAKDVRDLKSVFSFVKAFRG